MRPVRLFAVLGALVTAGPAAAAPLPGPPLLHMPAPPPAPQLTNAAPWKAEPILISGATAYRDGEFLYQDYLYDDHGARLAQDPNDRADGNDSFSLPNGTYTYPSDRAYAENAADLVEVRVKPLAAATALRFTLNTLKDPKLIAISVGLGGTAGQPHPFPFGANVQAPAERFVTVHPQGGAMVGTVTDADSGTTLGEAEVAVDMVRRQIDVRVPHALWDPGERTVRLTAGVGLWDGANRRYLLPGAASDATTPGGAGTSSAPAAFFNVAFRTAEPIQRVVETDTYVNNPAWWRDRQQGTALAAGDISDLHADVDFAKLARHVRDDSRVPTSGAMDRIHSSRFEIAQGIDWSAICKGANPGPCEFQGNLQPYALYVPKKPPPPAGYGMTLLLKGNASMYNLFLDSNHQHEYGERGGGSLVVTPEGRDNAGTYSAIDEADVFEAWADAARRYPVDPSWSAVSGYSLGALGATKLAESYPDLFGAVVSIVGTPNGPGLQSLRHVPIMQWDVTVDELNPYAPEALADMQQYGLRYESLLFPGDHFTPATFDEYGPAVDFLAEHRADPSPAHVTYVYFQDGADVSNRPQKDAPQYGLVADHAYWLSDLRVASPGTGTVDAVSHAFGQGDPAPSGPQEGAGTIMGGNLPAPLPYSRTYQTLGATPASPAADRIDLTLTNIGALTIDAARARVDCRADLHVTSDVPVTVKLAGCPGEQRFAGSS